MSHMSEEDFAELQRRRHVLQQSRDCSNPDYFINAKAADVPESVLQSSIKTYCKHKGWPCLSFPQTPAVRKFLPPGWWDITIKLPKGVTLDIEVKKVKGGRMSDKQKLMTNMLSQLGHTVHKIDTWEGFDKLIERKT